MSKLEKNSCYFCGKEGPEQGGNEMLFEHHSLGRNDPESEDPEKKTIYCFWHHEVAECRAWERLPFSNYFIQGRLFDLYVITKDYKLILSKIRNTARFDGLYKEER